VAPLRSLVLLLPLLCGGPALADDYPYTGNFAVADNPDMPGPLDAAHCALSFFTQNADGTFVSYHVDFDTFVKQNTVRYVVFNRGACILDTAKKIESCTVGTDTNQASIDKTYIDVIDQIGPQAIKTKLFDQQLLAQAYVDTGKTQAATAITYVRCPFDPEKLKAAITAERSTLAVEARNRLIAPDAAMLNATATRAIVAAMGLGAGSAP
jgi:hypothetical protein